MKKAYFVPFTLLLFPVLIVASPVDIPHQYQSGTLAKASEMNDNFSAVKVAIDDNNSRIKTLERQTGELKAMLSQLQDKLDDAYSTIEILNGELNITKNNLSTTKQALDAAQIKIDNTQQQLNALNISALSQVPSDLDRLSIRATQNEQRISSITQDVDTLSQRSNALRNSINILKNNTVLELDNLLSLDTSGSYPTAQFTDVNVQIINGLDDTHSTNGVGNLILGYHTMRTGGSDTNLRTGSHNLIIGNQHNYQSSAGAVLGFRNTLNAQSTTILGGSENLANAALSSITGGKDNHTSGELSVVAGGFSNTASGLYSAVAGGEDNRASGISSTVSGGGNNTASGEISSVSGGEINKATNTAASISGGINNRARGAYSSISGGGGPLSSWGNVAAGERSSILGGKEKNTLEADTTIPAGP